MLPSGCIQQLKVIIVILWLTIPAAIDRSERNRQLDRTEQRPSPTIHLHSIDALTPPEQR